METVDAVVIGAGPNGLVAANLLADAGWDVVVTEAASAPGGAVRTAEVTAPGFHNDLYSAFYPLAATPWSPIAALHLEEHGLEWCHAPDVIAHPRRDGPAPVLSRDVERTLASLAASSAADAEGWARLVDAWRRLAPVFVPLAVASRLPPITALGRFLRGAGMRTLADDARFVLLSASRMATEAGCGEAGHLLLGGNALHGDVLLEAPGSGILGLLLCGLGHDVGFPVPRGGAERLVDALVARLHHVGGQVWCDAPVERVVVHAGRARGVRLRDGRFVRARRGVVAAVSAPVLDALVPGWQRPQDAVRYQVATGTVKVDWALSGPVPWRDPAVSGAGTVHVAPTVDELSVQAHQLARGVLPGRPFALLGQMTTSDPTRSPPGTESAWAYTHVPVHLRQDECEVVTGRYDRDDLARIADRIEARVEEVAPGFRSRVLARHVAGPHELAAANASLAFGDISGGSVQLQQQGPFRPPGSLGTTATQIPGLHVGSSSVHPGGGVHGAPGARAARALVRRAPFGPHRRLGGRAVSARALPGTAEGPE